MLSFKQRAYLLVALGIAIIIIFILGTLRLLLKHIFRTSDSDSSEEATSAAAAFQGQLQQLFHLQDEGVGQSFIDSLPVFPYRSIKGLKDDCSVCLRDFDLDDRLRLLPNCGHGFHIECIDAWLLAHSTCPLCRHSVLVKCSQDWNLGTSGGNFNLAERCFSMEDIDWVSGFNGRESFSVSKIWMRSRRDKSVSEDWGFGDRRAFSFRLPENVDDLGFDVEDGRKKQKIDFS